MPAPPRAGEEKDDFLGRCIPFYVKEGKPQDQAVAICYSMWRRKDEERIIKKIDMFLGETEGGATTTGDVAINTSGKGYPITRRIKKKKKKTDETIVTGGPYLSGTSTAAGSGQTRVVGDKDNEIDALKTKPNARFNKLLGAYISEAKYIPNMKYWPDDADDIIDYKAAGREFAEIARIAKDLPTQMRDVTASIGWAMEKNDKRKVALLVKRFPNDIIGGTGTLNRIIKWIKS